MKQLYNEINNIWNTDKQWYEAIINGNIEYNKENNVILLKEWINKETKNKRTNNKLIKKTSTNNDADIVEQNEVTKDNEETNDIQS